jgi:hypothetical protein
VCAVGGVDTVVCAPDDEWKYHPKHVEQFPDINKLCNVASCWVYEYIGILLGARPILHISTLKVNSLCCITAFLDIRARLLPEDLKLFSSILNMV